LGKTGNLLQRIYHNHLMGDKQASSVKRKLINNFGLRDEKEVKDYLGRKCSLQFIVIKNKNELKFVEHFLISILRPKYND
jgi:excinuclease UvrABC nuclease subunit